MDTASWGRFEEAETAGSRAIREIRADAWDLGFTAAVREQMHQHQDPSHPITRTNPYEAK